MTIHTIYRAWSYDIVRARIIDAAETLMMNPATVTYRPESAMQNEPQRCLHHRAALTNRKHRRLPMATANRICSVDACNRPSRARGMCVMHYARTMKHGNASTARGVHRKSQKTGAEIDRLVTHEGDDCVQWPFYRDGNGYARVSVDGKHNYVHRLICERVHGPAPTPKHQAAHSCGKGHEGCVNPRHLRWATAKENVADRKVHGTQMYGEDAPRAKLSERDVRHIRRWLERGYSQPRVAKEFGVSVSVIHDITTGKSWGWLQ